MHRGKKTPLSNVLLEIFYPASIIVLGIVAYSNSFQGVFLLDDATILDNPQIHQLRSIASVFQNSNRPLLNLSFALNYFWSGTDVGSYHAFNLVVHLVAGLALFGILRRTFRLPRLAETLQKNSSWTAWIMAVLWLLHPLQTASVTYISQRAESLAGMFYLLTVYCAIRKISSVSPRSFPWQVPAILFCALGLATKEILVTAPVLIGIYHRTFFAESLSAMWQRHKVLYAGLAATWLAPVFLLTQTHGYGETAGFGVKDVSPIHYALTQPAVIFHYLKLAFYPAALCFDYQWPLVTKISDAVVPLAGLTLAALLTMFAWRRRPEVSFPGIAFFLTLALSSSFIPIKDAAFEHRMYLPLIPVITGAVLIVRAIFQRCLQKDNVRWSVGALLVLLAVGGLGGRTYVRNLDYHGEIGMWQDVVRKRPQNWRAYNNLGLAYLQEGNFKEAERFCRAAAALRPDFDEAYNNIGMVYLRQNDLAQAEHYFRRALSINPAAAEFRTNLGSALAGQGKGEEAMREYEETVRRNPGYAEAYNNLGVSLVGQGRLDRAVANYQQAIFLKPHYAAAYNNLGVVFINQGNPGKAAPYFQRALEIQPEYPKALNNLGVAFNQLGRPNEARKLFVRAVTLDPTYDEARRNLSAMSKEILSK